MDTCFWCHKEVLDAERHLADTPKCQAAKATAEAVAAGLDYPVTLADRVALTELGIVEWQPTAAGPAGCENEMWGPKAAITLLAYGYGVPQLRSLIDRGGVRALDLEVTAMAISGEKLVRRPAGAEDKLVDAAWDDDDEVIDDEEEDF